MNETKTLVKSIIHKTLALLLVIVLLFGYVPVLHINGDGDVSVQVKANPLIPTAYAADVKNGSGTWISGKLTYSYSVATADSNTSGADGSVSVSNGTMTVKATNAEKYTTGS